MFLIRIYFFNYRNIFWLSDTQHTATFHMYHGQPSWKVCFKLKLAIKFFFNKEVTI